jgi:hypothetical protein
MCDVRLDELIPYDWTSDQAHAVVDFLEILAEDRRDKTPHHTWGIPSTEDYRSSILSPAV